MISENTKLQIEQFSVTVIENIGQRNDRIRYFKVRIDGENAGDVEEGLLRVGSATGLLRQELQLRSILGEYALVAPLLAQTTVSDMAEIVKESQPLADTSVETPQIESEITQPPSFPPPTEEKETFSLSIIDKEKEAEILETPGKDAMKDRLPPDEETPSSEDSESSEVAKDGDYLEEEFYPEHPLPGDEGDRLLLLTTFPDSQLTLSQWLKTTHSPTEVLKSIAQICQLFWYFHQNGWCAIDLDPDFLEIGQPIRCFDLAWVYPKETSLPSGLMGAYCAPELAFNPIPDEKTSTYTIGALLYCALYGQPPEGERSLESLNCSVPRFSQLLALSLSPVPDDRFSLAQLRSLLIETRNSLTVDRVSWETASESTVGLSAKRLHNEDSYGIALIDRGNNDIVVLAVLADGMGGMASGEVASRLAVKAVLDGFYGQGRNVPEERNEWLVSLAERANAEVTEAVSNGGTTLSLVLAESRKLSLAHVGDSRIYLGRDGELRQLSEDHSLVALLVASGQISVEESQEHPDRNVLTKSLGSKKHLSQGYVQTVCDLELKDGDLVLLCSDGVWDVASDRELMEQFAPSTVLQTAVNNAIELVLKRGAPDNATLLALRCRISPVEVAIEVKTPT